MSNRKPQKGRGTKSQLVKGVSRNVMVIDLRGRIILLAAVKVVKRFEISLMLRLYTRRMGEKVVL